MSSAASEMQADVRRPSERRHGRESEDEVDKQPKNSEGQPPTKTPAETVDRLEQKKHEDIGGANRKRIEKQEEEVEERR